MLIESGFTPEEMGGFNPDAIEAELAKDDDESKIEVVFSITIPNAEASSFENQLDVLVKKFPTANKKRT